MQQPTLAWIEELINDSEIQIYIHMHSNALELLGNEIIQLMCTEMKLLFCFLIATSYCLVEILAKSECEENQKKALTRKEKWIPKCTESGKFEALQCYENTSECMCLRPDGTRVVEPSTKVKSCTCHIHKDNVDNKRLIGAWKPRCEEDGSYQKKQCSGSTGSFSCQGDSFFTIVFVFHSTQLNNEVRHPRPGGVLLLGGGPCPDRVPGEAREGTQDQLECEAGAPLHGERRVRSQAVL
ncbi:thyroglobulin type-1 domain-containing protein [Caerostris extrusa]|uniref:Thyroglobulin type-1 domain-containing protein n=1 Tax=Caerostris extrusa TaxID=172846 RepID=A0AAV4N916_CAEEX|nr:thyroglobulin type-1 domain-containing protein [Caerostris extrusa]